MRRAGKIRGWAVPVLLLCVFVLTRLLILFYSTTIYHDEEEFRGTVAKEIIEGNRFGLLDYQYTA